MNILQVIPELNVGGVETGTVDFAKYLMDHGHKAVVVSHGGALVPKLESLGARHYTLSVHKKSIRGMLRAVKDLRQIIRAEKIDIVHARSRVPAWIAYFACRKTKAAFITTCHGYYQNRFFSQVMGWSKLVIVPSKIIGHHMVHDFNVSARSIRCIARSVDLERFKVPRKPGDGKPRCHIAMIGRITPLKGHSYFLRAMARVVRSVPYATVSIIGDAPAKKMHYKEGLMVLTRRLGLQDRVQFLGNREDIPEILAGTDIVVLGTITQEAFGRVIVEAQAAGVPVVATQVGGVVDIIEHGVNGLLVPAKDIEKMADAVIRLANDRGLANRLAVEARANVEKNFTLDRMAQSTLKVYEELLKSMNILVIKFGAIGDVVLVTASLKALRKKFPYAQIHCLVGKESRKVLQNCPFIDGIIVADGGGSLRGWSRLFRLSRTLRKYRFDVAVDFQNNRKSHFLAFLSMARESYGYNRKWGRLLTHPVADLRKDLPPVAHQFQLLEKLGIDYSGNPYLQLWPSKKDQEHAAALLESEWMGGEGTHIVGINVAASAKWPTKNWPVEWIARLCDMLTAKGVRVILTGMEKDTPLIRELLTMTKSKPANFAGKTDTLQLASLIGRCRVYVTPDSAPLHVAAAMDTSVVALFGPTDSARHVPPARHLAVLEKKLACAPCYNSRCRILTHACMKEIRPEDVLREVELLMGEHP